MAIVKKLDIKYSGMILSDHEEDKIREMARDMKCTITEAREIYCRNQEGLLRYF